MQIDFIVPIPACAGMTRIKDSCKNGTHDLGPVVKPQDDKSEKRGDDKSEKRRNDKGGKSSSTKI